MATIKIRNRKNRSSYGIAITLLVIVILVVGAAYFYFKISAIQNSEEVQAEKIDYLIHITDPENPVFVLLRNKKGYGNIVLELPEYLALEPLEKSLTGTSLDEIKKLLDSWLGISSDEYYYWETDKDGIRSFASKLGFSAESYRELLDKLSRRGFKFLDYWRLKDYVAAIEKYDNSARISKAGLAAMLLRLRDENLRYFEISVITKHPIEIKTSVSGKPIKRLYLEEKSLEDLMSLFEEW
ncbi:hypothetical protein [Kosmotoga pacifica]|uniref:Uncharacterized protein n=1 Tax=Kosmotoga pacifica TaxID=1330330 RepID=A0A0G2ZA45_9BACT|nr:hypothetical protein [Kosmotoga pacifica]AKI96946.1 hypothetical protein IX53_02925 [Kosmotoga pacifica]